MDLKVFDPHELTIALRALRGVGAQNGAFTEAERALVTGIARIHGAEVDVDALAPITPDEVARGIRDPHRRKRAIQLALVMALVEGEADRETERSIRELARALDVDDNGLEVLREVAGGHLLMARFDMARRITRTLAPGEGLAGVFRLTAPLLGLGRDEATAARYRALGERAPGSFGRAFFDHIRGAGFFLPGEKGGFPERGVFHDAGHVLSGYGVDPAGEIQQAAFQGGFMRRDGFVFLLFGILQFHVGLRLTPVAKAERGNFDVPKVLRAAERGAACTVDLTDGWSFWDVVDVPLEELRARYRIPSA